MNMDIFEQRVRDRAYLMWEAEGCPAGRDVEHWRLSEEQEMLAELAKVGPAVEELKAKVAPKKKAAPKGRAASAKVAASA